MKVFPRKRVNQNVKESQAVPDDYRNSSFTRGHLNPSMHQGTTEDREATFTLTNIVPQKKASNAGPWNDLEKEVSRNFQDYCNGPMYVITGALLYASNNRRLNNRVSVPEYLWSAYCCPSFSDQLPAAMKPFFPAYAAVGRNDPNSTEEIVPADVTAEDMVKGYGVKKMSVSALEDILNQRLASNISLFSRQCKWRLQCWNHFSCFQAKTPLDGFVLVRNHLNSKGEIYYSCSSWKLVILCQWAGKFSYSINIGSNWCSIKNILCNVMLKMCV